MLRIAPRISRLLSLAATAVIAACAGDAGARAGSPTTTRDSVGIQIVENEGPRWPAKGGWELAAQPLIDLADDPEVTGHDIGQTSAALFLPDGRIAIASGGSNTVKFFDPTGKHLSTFGRPGSGPGEFQFLHQLWIGPGDSLIALERIQRVSVFVDNTFGRSYTIGVGDGARRAGGRGPAVVSGGRAMMTVEASAAGAVRMGPGGMAFGGPIVGAFSDGTLLGRRGGLPPNLQELEGEVTESVTLVRYGRDGIVTDSLGKFPGSDYLMTSVNMRGHSFKMPIPATFGRTLVTAIGGDRIYVARNNTWEVEVLKADGSLERVIRIPADSVPVTEAMIAAYKEQTFNQMKERTQGRVPEAQLKEQFDMMSQTTRFAPALTWIAAIQVSNDGTIWVEEVQPPGLETQRFAIIDSSGAFLGRLTLPPRFQLLAIKNDQIAGVWRDEDDIEHLQVYTIER